MGTPLKLVVRMTLMVSPDLRGADVGGDIREEEEVPCRDLGDSANRRETSLASLGTGHCV